jgi:hypothetical protein
MMMDFERTLAAYERAWQQPDEEEKVRAVVEEFWTPASTFVNPLIDMVQGIDGLTRLIVDYPVLFPDVEIRCTGKPDTVAAYVRYPWRLSSSARIRMLGQDFGHALEGTDILAVNDDGEITSVVSFFGSTSCR